MYHQRSTGAHVMREAEEGLMGDAHPIASLESAANAKRCQVAQRLEITTYFKYFEVQQMSDPRAMMVYVQRDVPPTNKLVVWMDDNKCSRR